MKVIKQVVVPFSIGNDKDQPNTKRNHGNNTLEVPIGTITRAKVKIEWDCTSYMEQDGPRGAWEI